LLEFHIKFLEDKRFDLGLEGFSRVGEKNQFTIHPK
jgi:hypothetical protein